MAETGLCADGEQEKLLADGATEINGTMPVNTDGGLIANGEPIELACLAYELLTWTQLLAFHDRPARSWEPKRLRLRILSVAARLITTGRRRILRLSKRWPWTDHITSGHQRLVALA